MTNEEAIENIKLIRFNAAITNANSFKEALDMAIEALSKPSIPSNLDEAAELFDRENAARMWDYEGKTTGEIVESAFKAGTEWMAGQGVSVKGLLYGGSLGIPDIPEEFYTDKVEEVIVQIRKK